MKAYVLHNTGDIRYEEADNPIIGHGELLIKVNAAGICGSDIPRIYRTGAHVMPLIPGHEFSGTVTACMPENGDNTKLIGRRVGVSPLIPCRGCAPCIKGRYEMCRNYNYLGSRCNGAFAEYVKVPAGNVIELPDNVSCEEAAMLEPMSVAVHAMRMTSVRKEDVVVVYGLGTIGLLLTMFLKDAGIDNIFVIGNKSIQRAAVKNSGIPDKDYHDSSSGSVKEWILEKTNGRGADVVFECIGKNETIESSIDIAAPAGRLVLAGNPCQDMKFSRDIYWKILRNQLNIRGTWNSSFTGEFNDDWHYVLKKLKEGKVNPSQFITHRFKPWELYRGLEIMRDKTEEYIKIMMVM